MRVAQGRWAQTPLTTARPGSYVAFGRSSPDTGHKRRSRQAWASRERGGRVCPLARESLQTSHHKVFGRSANQIIVPINDTFWSIYLNTKPGHLTHVKLVPSMVILANDTVPLE